MMEWHALPKARCQSLTAVVLGVLLLCGGPSFALERGAARHEFISLKNITAERGKEFLAQLKIGTVSRLPNTDTLLITGDEIEQQKVAAILDLVDSRTEFSIRVLGPVFPALPSNAEIAGAVGSICIGTFANPPKDRTQMRAIVDVHDGHVVVIAPTMQLQDIRVAIELSPEVLRQRRGMAAPAGSTNAATVQASAMFESSLDPSTEETKVVAAEGARPSKYVLSKEMKARLEEMRRSASEKRSLYQAGLEPATAPASAAIVPADPLASGASSLGRTDPNKVESAVPAGLQHVGASPDQNAPADGLPMPAAPETAAEGDGLQPGQRVPSGSERITQPDIEPKSITNNAPKSMAEMLSPAQSSAAYEPAEVPGGEELINLGLPESLPVIDLLDLVGKNLGLTYLYDPQYVTGTVTLKLNGTLKGQVRKKDLYALLEAALQEKDLVMTRHGNIVRIMRKVDAMKADPIIVMPGEGPIEPGDAIITRPFHLKYIDSTSAMNLFDGMDLAVKVTSVTESRTIIVTAYAHRMARIEQLLELVDRPGTPRKFKDRQLKYTMAKNLANKVKSLAEQLENVSVTVGTAAEPTTGTPPQQPNESDVAYRTRLAQIRQAQNVLRAQRAAAAAAGQAGQESKPGVYLDADERTNRILMIGEDEQLAMVEELVEALDVAQQDLRALQLYRMKYVGAEEVALKLQELDIIRKAPETSASQRTAQGPRITGQTPAQARAAAAQAAVAAETGGPEGTELTEEGLVGEPQVVVVESTNSLLVNGTPEQHAKIASIISYVDSETDLNEIPYQIYQLQNSSPDHLSEVLQNLIQETIEQEKEGKIEKTVVNREEKIRIVPDPNTYSLIVYANKKNQEWISNLIEKLDRRRPQVLIDVTLVEITQTDAFEYDLNVIGDKSKGGSADPNAGLLKRVVQWGGGSLSAFYRDDEINAVLTAMQTKSYGRVLARPKLLVNDNQEGTISNTNTTYVKVQSSVPFTNGTAGNQENLITTSTNFQEYPTGITLAIQPHISEGDLLMLTVGLTVSNVTKTVSESPPDQRERKIDTIVTLPDRSTVILGGLLQMNQSKGSAKVPILGDIPLIGGLFRSIDNRQDDQKLYVFIKAEIIRPADTVSGLKDLETISDRNRMAFEKHELKFQQYEDWPGIKPKPVDPPKVLEVQ